MQEVKVLGYIARPADPPEKAASDSLLVPRRVTLLLFRIEPTVYPRLSVCSSGFYEVIVEMKAKPRKNSKHWLDYGFSPLAACLALLILCDQVPREEASGQFRNVGGHKIN